jgi:hypothetical protein
VARGGNQVTEGRKKNDLYIRLKEPIDLSRNTFKQRVPDSVREKFDYLQDELVRQLAEGQPERMGPEARLKV